MRITNVWIADGTGADLYRGDVEVEEGRITAVGDLGGAPETFDGKGLVLSPGFIDSHTHDDLLAICEPQMLPKLSQGVTAVIAGNCGISAAPVEPASEYPEPMGILGEPDWFRFATFAEYKHALAEARPALNIAAFVGHTALRNDQMDSLDRAATPAEVARMKERLREALSEGALGLSTGLAYRSAFAASKEEVIELAEPLAEFNGLYATHVRNEGGQVLPAMEEALEIGRRAGVPVVVSHLKCAGVDNWGRSSEVLSLLESAGSTQEVGWDCYPYAASSTVLDPDQIDERIKVTITWSRPHPEEAGRSLQEIAALWRMPQSQAAPRLTPAGAIYHSMSEDDLRRIITHPQTMIGSDGLPFDRHPHPRLWGTFPRVLARLCREQGLFSLTTAIRKMTGLPAERYRLIDRGFIQAGCRADLVLFDPDAIADQATYDEPTQPAIGIEAVWVGGILSLDPNGATGERAGTFVPREPTR